MRVFGLNNQQFVSYVCVLMMAPLSKALAGAILDHEVCGGHLDASGKTMDDDLEKKNFKFAGEVL